VGGCGPEPVKERLSRIIDILNERFGTDFTPADQLTSDQIEEDLVANQELAEQARANSIDNYRFGFEDAFIGTVLDRQTQNAEIVRRILDDPAFATAAKDMLICNVCERQKSAQAED